MREQMKDQSKVNNYSLELSSKNWASYTSYTKSDFGDVHMGKVRNHGYNNWGLVNYYSENIDGKIFLNIEVLRSNQSHIYPGYNVSEITDKNHRVSFFTSKEEFRNAQGKSFKIVSKIKSHGTVWKQDHINETRLNYVKVI